MHVYKNKGAPFTQEYNFIANRYVVRLKALMISRLQSFYMSSSSSCLPYKRIPYFDTKNQSICKNYLLSDNLISSQITWDILYVKYLNSFPFTHTIRNSLFSSVHMAINNNLVHIKTMREAFWQTMPHNNQESFCYEDCCYQHKKFQTQLHNFRYK